MTQKKNLMDIIGNSSFDFAKFQREAIEKLKNGEPLLGEDGIVTPLIKQILEASLEGEMGHHLEECSTTNISNRRNGKSRKQVKLGVGSFELETPRDRDGSSCDASI